MQPKVFHVINHWRGKWQCCTEFTMLMKFWDTNCTVFPNALSNLTFCKFKTRSNKSVHGNFDLQMKFDSSISFFSFLGAFNCLCMDFKTVSVKTRSHTCRFKSLTSRIGAAVSCMDRMCVMLCFSSSSLSRASVHHKDTKTWILESISVHSQISNLNKKFSAPQKQTCPQRPQTLTPVLNWKKNRKTNVSKTVEQLGQKQETVILLIKF